MSQLSLQIPDEINDIISSLKQTFSISSIVEVSGVSTIITESVTIFDNLIETMLLKSGMVVTLGNVNYQVTNVVNSTNKSFDITATGLTDTEWNVAASFKFGSRNEIDQGLKQETNNDNKLKRFPLIWLFTPIEKDFDNQVIDFESDLVFAFAFQANKTDRFQTRLDGNIKTILEPLLKLFTLWMQSSDFNYMFEFEGYQKALNVKTNNFYFYGTSDQSKSVLNTTTDAIEAEMTMKFKKQFVYPTPVTPPSPIIPFYSDALFWLDGVILGNEFVDRTANERNFTITNKDFSDDFTKGFPYKSAATISAPIGDTVLIANDINNFLYDSGGTPNDIPVVSFFQNIDYEDKLFCRHGLQVLDSNSVETYEPRVLDITLYDTVKERYDLLNCEDYYAVPIELTSNVKWVAKDGNDTTGNGTKEFPWLTMSHAETNATNGDTVYVKSGIYAENGVLSSFYWRFERDWISIGRSEIRQANQNYVILASTTATTRLKGFIINAESKNYCVNFSASTENRTIENCYIYNSVINEIFITKASTQNNTFKNCIFNSTSASSSVTTRTPILVDGCLFSSTSNDSAIFADGIAVAGDLVVRYSKIIGTYSNYAINIQQVNQFDVTIFNNVFEVSSTDSVLINNQKSTEINYNLFKTEVSGNEIAVGTSSTTSTKTHIKYNTILTKSLTGYSLKVGAEGTSGGDNLLTDIQIIGNKIFGAKYYSPLASPTKHAIMIGFQNQASIIMYNYVDGSGINILTKGSNSDYSNCIISYNISANAYLQGIYHKATNNTKCYGNTLVNNSEGFRFSENIGGDPAIGHELKNNIITTDSGYLYNFDVASYAQIQVVDSNNIYIQDKLAYDGSADVDITAWNTKGYDINSQNGDPLLTNFIPQSGSPAIDNGENLGVNYNTGLDETTNWGDENTLPVIVTRTQATLWDIGAYIS